MIAEGTKIYQATFDKQVSFSEAPNLDEIALQLPYKAEGAYIPSQLSPHLYSRVGMVYKLIPYNFIEYWDYYLSKNRLEEKVEVEDDKKILKLGRLNFTWNEDTDSYDTTFTKNSALKPNDDVRFGYYINGAGELKTYIKIIDRTGFNDLAWVSAESGEDPILDRDSRHSYLQREYEPIQYFKEVYQYDYSETYDKNDPKYRWWNVLVKDSPESLIFWFDFLDRPYSEMGKYGVKQVMDRSKAENNSNASAICFRDALNLVYYYSDTPERLVKGAMTAEYDIYKMSKGFRKYFKLSNANKSCKDILDNWLYAHTWANESITITTVPIYTLQPNNRINIDDDNTLINGEYVINSISIPLTYNGLSTVQCTKIVSNLY